MKYLLYLILLIIVSGCFLPASTPNYVIKNFNMCYSPNTKINNKIRLDGYYGAKCKSDTYASQLNPDAICDSYIFYEDGTVFRNVRLTQNLQAIGTYKFQGEEIKTQIVNIAQDNTYIDEYTFKILNDSTLFLYHKKGIRNFGEYDTYNDTLSKTYTHKFYFAPLKTKPDNHYFWLKKKEWFWCDKNEHKSYMQELKNRGKGF